MAPSELGTPAGTGTQPAPGEPQTTGAPETTPMPPAPPQIEPLTASRPVQLIYGWAVPPCSSCWVWHGMIEVENLAYDKDIAVVYHRPADGSIRESQATYVSTLPSGRELWTFGSVGGDGTTTFSIRYRNGRDTYWDTNGGGGYVGRIEGGAAKEWPIGANRDVVVIDDRVNVGWFETSSHNLYVDVLVRNRAPTKDIRLVYSTDNWATVQEGRFSYHSGSPAQGAERWRIFQPMRAGTRQVAFAVVSRQAGVESWDNNYNQNFACVVDPMNWKLWRCSLAARLSL